MEMLAKCNKDDTLDSFLVPVNSMKLNMFNPMPVTGTCSKNLVPVDQHWQLAPEKLSSVSSL